MSTEAVDRRVRRTRKQLRECLVTLLKQKKVQDITVRTGRSEQRNFLSSL
jgi:flagellar basal body-associated protein FliL